MSSLSSKSFIGKDCKKLHGGERYLSSKVCVQCHREAFRRWQEKFRRVSRHIGAELVEQVDILLLTFDDDGFGPDLDDAIEALRKARLQMKEDSSCPAA